MISDTFFQTKKICLCFFLFIFIGNLSFGQQKQVLEDEELAEINRVILIFENALKKSDVSIIKDQLSPNFSCMGYEAPMALSSVLPQVLKQMPKGEIELINSTKKNGTYNLAIAIIPMQVPLKMDLDEKFKILSLNQRNDASAVPKPENGIEKKAKRISLPFHLIDGFILIDAEINGKKGKLMFDTGNPNKFLLNNNYLELNKDVKLSSGKVGSGQTIEVYKDEVEYVSLGLDFRMSSQSVQHADFGFTQIGITSEMMGFIGYEFMKDYEFVIDYDDQIIEMYLITENQENKFYNEDEIVVELDFSTPFMPNIPYVDFECKGQKIKANFDTGNQGNLHLNESKTKTFIKSGIINQVESNGIYGQPAKITKYTMDDLSYKGLKIEKIKNMVNNEDSGMPATKESDFNLGAGYQFLKNYRSVWNFKTKKIILLKR